MLLSNSAASATVKEADTAHVHCMSTVDIASSLWLHLQDFMAQLQLFYFSIFNATNHILFTDADILFCLVSSLFPHTIICEGFWLVLYCFAFYLCLRMMLKLCL